MKSVLLFATAMTLATASSWEVMSASNASPTDPASQEETNQIQAQELHQDIDHHNQAIKELEERIDAQNEIVNHGGETLQASGEKATKAALKGLGDAAKGGATGSEKSLERASKQGHEAVKEIGRNYDAQRDLEEAGDRAEKAARSIDAHKEAIAQDQAALQKLDVANRALHEQSSVPSASAAPPAIATDSPEGNSSQGDAESGRSEGLGTSSSQGGGPGSGTADAGPPESSTPSESSPAGGGMNVNTGEFQDDNGNPMEPNDSVTEVPSGESDDAASSDMHSDDQSGEPESADTADSDRSSDESSGEMDSGDSGGSDSGGGDSGGGDDGGGDDGGGDD